MTNRTSRKFGLSAVIPVLTILVLTTILGPAMYGTEQQVEQGQGEKSMEDKCRQEVLDLHQFFEDWFMGRLADDDKSFARFSSVMDDTFRIVSPAGTMTPIPALSKGLRGAHGAWDKGGAPVGRIWIENVDVRLLSDTLALVTYEEWQEQAQPAKGRQSTALFEVDVNTPNGVRWLHVHETWLPPSAESSE